MDLPNIAIHIADTASQFKYVILFLGMIVEGPIFMIASGVLLKLGFLSLVPTFIVLYVGDLIADVGWYYIGYYLAEPALRKQGKFFGLTPERFERVKRFLHRHNAFILFVSKITLGFGASLGTLMVAGAARVPLRLYILYNALGEIILVSALVSIGYFFGGLYGTIARGFDIVLIVGLSISTIILLYGVFNLIRQSTIKL